MFTKLSRAIARLLSIYFGESRENALVSELFSGFDGQCICSSITRYLSSVRTHTASTLSKSIAEI